MTLATARYSFDGVALTTRQAVFSTREGLFVRDIEGAASAVRLGPRCEGGVAALERDATWIACSHRPHLDQGRPGHVELISFEPQRTRRWVLGTVGRDADGVAIAAQGDAVRVAWHDGTPGAWRVFWAQVDPRSGPREPSLVSAAERAAGAPSLQTDGDDVWITWAETWLDAGYPHGRVRTWNGRGVPSTVAEVDVQHPTPVLTHDDEGPVLIFRDHRRPWRRVSVFAQRLDARRRAVGEPERVGRANGDGAPRAVACGPHLWVASPRTWDGDTLVGINVLDDRLRKQVAEQQVYEWDAHFARTDVRCGEVVEATDDAPANAAIVALVAEQGESARPEVGLHAITLRCE